MYITNLSCIDTDVKYTDVMPKLWTETIEAHRREVRDAILDTWHERQVTGHLEYLAEVGHRAGDAGERLAAVLEAYALISHESHGHHDTEVATFLHRGEHVA